MGFEFFFFAIFFSIIAYFAYAMFRHGGFRGAMFGAQVVPSVGEVSSTRRGLLSQKLKVHILRDEDPATQSVGLEFTSSGPGSWSTIPITLSGSEVRKLILLLEQALNTPSRRY